MKKFSVITKQAIKKVLPRRFHPVMWHLRKAAWKSRRRQRVLGRFARAVLADSYNGKLLIAASDIQVGRCLFEDGEYDRSVIEYHLNHLTPASNVLIVGAHVGSLLIPIAKHVSRVVGVEANPATFELLSMNVMLNGLENVDVFNFAAGNENTTMRFIQHSHNTGASRLTINQGLEDPTAFYDDPEIVEIDVRVLDEAIPLYEFDLIIMDVEGAEYLALLGMTDILQKSGRLQMEVCPFLLSRFGEIAAEQLIGAVAPYFSRARIIENACSGKEWSEIDPLLHKVFRSGKLHDILLAK